MSFDQMFGDNFQNLMDIEEPVDPKLKALLENEGYFAVTMRGGKVCCLCRMVFTVAILVNVDEQQYQYRYCYRDLGTATAALLLWNGSGHPPMNGFIKVKPDSYHEQFFGNAMNAKL